MKMEKDLIGGENNERNFDEVFMIPIEYQKELDRRLTRFENGETAFYTWEEIRKELTQKKQ